MGSAATERRVSHSPFMRVWKHIHIECIQCTKLDYLLQCYSRCNSNFPLICIVLSLYIQLPVYVSSAVLLQTVFQTLKENTTVL